MRPYREVGKTLTSMLRVASTTRHTRNIMVDHNNSDIIGLDDEIEMRDIGISKDKMYELPLNGVSKVITIVSAHRFIILYRATDQDEYAVLAICSGQFHVTGALQGQIAIQGDYSEPTRCSIVYS